MKNGNLIKIGLIIGLLYLAPIASAQHFVAVDQGQWLGPELVTNGDMELDSDWPSFGYDGGETNERSSEQAYSGTYSRKIIVDDSNEGIVQASLTMNVGWYTLSFWVYPASTTACKYYWEDGGGVQISVTTVIGLTQNSWNYFSLEGYSANSGSSGRIILRSNAAGTWYFDDASIIQTLP